MMDLQVGTDLLSCERVIERGMRHFAEAGIALKAIRDQRLYREQDKTFDAYCERRWGWKHSQVYRLIDAAQAMQDLSPMGDRIPLPTAERTVRPLTALTDPLERRAVWEQAVNETPDDGAVTGARLEQVIRSFASATTANSNPAKRHVRAVRDFPELEPHKQGTALDYAAAVYQDPSLRFSGKSVDDIARIGHTLRADRQQQDQALRENSTTSPELDVFTRAQYQASTHLLVLDTGAIARAIPTQDIDLVRRWCDRMQRWLTDLQTGLDLQEAASR